MSFFDFILSNGFLVDENDKTEEIRTICLILEDH